ncbi:MAG TPA: hypothetical protein VFI22_04505, partial [Thermomicrobiales bacterium]|nr:hypothetical protein [Thermomicrobiales bacterium]
MFNLNELSGDVARQRHLDFMREAERERRLNEIAAPASGLPAAFARAWAALRRARDQRRPIAGR